MNLKNFWVRSQIGRTLHHGCLRTTVLFINNIYGVLNVRGKVEKPKKMFYIKAGVKVKSSSFIINLTMNMFSLMPNK